MACNLRCGALTIAILTIIFCALGIIHIAKRHHHGHHDDEYEMRDHVFENDAVQGDTDGAPGHPHHHKHGKHHHGGHHKHHGHHKHGKHHHHHHHHSGPPPSHPPHHHTHHHHHTRHHHTGRPTGQPTEFPTTNEPVVDIDYEEREEEEREEPEALEMTDDDRDYEKDEPEDAFKKHCHRYGKVAKGVGIAGAVISILTSVAVFFTVTKDEDKNKRRRHLLLPYVLWHSFCAGIVLAAMIYAMIRYHHYLGTSKATYAFLIVTADIVILALFSFFVGKYHKSLNVDFQQHKHKGFVYEEMENEVEEKKVPLA